MEKFRCTLLIDQNVIAPPNTEGFPLEKAAAAQNKLQQGIPKQISN